MRTAGSRSTGLVPLPRLVNPFSSHTSAAGADAARRLRQGTKEVMWVGGRVCTTDIRARSVFRIVCLQRGRLDGNL